MSINAYWVWIWRATSGFYSLQCRKFRCSLVNSKKHTVIRKTCKRMRNDKRIRKHLKKCNCSVEIISVQFINHSHFVRGRWVILNTLVLLAASACDNFVKDKAQHCKINTSVIEFSWTVMLSVETVYLDLTLLP